MNKNILVVSHQRSGTHFLINSIAFNFDYYTNKWLDLPTKYDINVVGDFINKQRFTHQIYKSHHQSYSFDLCFKKLFDNFHVFYIIRDGRDVITSSFIYYTQRQKWYKSKNMADFIRENPTGKIMDNRYGYKKSQNMPQMWANHVKSWLDAKDLWKDKIHIFFYENLLLEFNGQIARISRILQMPPVYPIHKPTLKDKGVCNRKGIIGDYKNYFSEEDERFFFLETINIRKQLFTKRQFSVQYIPLKYESTPRMAHN